MDPSLHLTSILLSLIFSAFFSGMEIAFLSSNRLKVELDRSKGNLVGKILGVFYKRESRFIAMMLLGNNIALVIFGMSFAALIDGPDPEHSFLRSIGITQDITVLLTQTVLSTLLVLITAEFLPKAFVQLNPNWFLKLLAVPMLVVYAVLYLPTLVIVGLSNGILRLFNVRTKKEQQVFSKVDLEHFVQDISSRIKEEQELENEMTILQNALDFSSLKARDCMIPRTEIVAVEVNETIPELSRLFIDTGLSKILIYRDNLDNVIGYVHSFEMFKKPSSIKQILLPISFVPAAIPGKELLELFTKQSGNIAVVVDEYGGTAGLITIEDVIEEIFGEIEDEHDKEDWLEEKISDSEYRFSARADIDYLNDAYKLGLPESEEYDTLGGLVIHELETIPEAGTQIELDELSLFIEQVSDRRIEVVKVYLK
ncbi:MAG: hemolysin family protein [Bacteroidota bacterium]|jgi:putative hemolysin